MITKESNEAKRRGSPSREMLYAEAAKYAPRAIEVLGELLENPNENVRVSAAKAILAKAIPDLKSTEISTFDQNQFRVTLPSWAIDEQV